ncbi:MAG: GspE/PulE family protein [Patescibacteria group bacterium]
MLSFYTHATVARPFESGQIQVSPDKIIALRHRIRNVADAKKELAAAFASRVTDALEVILAGALSVDGSDVHIEPHETSSRLRFRIDGILQDIAEIPPRLSPLLLSRIKLIAEMKLNIRDEPQDGHFTLHIGGDEIEMRVSLLPGPNGENVVLRVLDPKAIHISFADLGLQPWIVDQMTRELQKTKGMILTTGPTGSGKTTTLYSFLRERSSPEVKIITIEDPIEYRIPGIEQTQISPDTSYTFANGLRSIVRQDPDIVLVGEIRDHDTAEAAMHAALTGHLVFSTLHTNNAAGTIPRLVDLGVAPPIIAPAINVIMAQRLIRKLCETCKIPAQLSPEEKKAIASEIAGIPSSVTVPKEPEWKINKSPPEKKCPSCHLTGYKGRIGVFEILLASNELERQILQKPAEIDIRDEMRRQGQITMRQDGILKILSGVTDLAELNRVINV